MNHFPRIVANRRANPDSDSIRFEPAYNKCKSARDQQRALKAQRRLVNRGPLL
jgi:hypothetical protein